MGIVKLRFTKTRVEECGGKTTNNRNDSKTKWMGVGNWEGVSLRKIGEKRLYRSQEME